MNTFIHKFGLFFAALVWFGTYGDVYAVVDTNKACSKGACEPIGRSYYMTNINVLSNSESGINIFSKSPKLSECVQQTNRPIVSRDGFYSKSSMDNLVNSLAADSGLDGGVLRINRYTLSSTVSANTGYAADYSSSFKSVKYERSIVDSALDWVKECYSGAGLKPEVIKDFEILPLFVSENASSYVASDERWQSYTNFFYKYGTYILSGLDYGSSFQIWESAGSADAELDAMLKARICMSLSANGDQSNDIIPECGNITASVFEKAKSLPSNERYLIHGGTDLTRTNLLGKTSLANLNMFIAASNNSDEAIAGRYVPLWDILKEAYRAKCTQPGTKDCNNYQRAINLEAAYLGFVAFGCDRRLSANSIQMGGMKTTAIDSQGIKTWTCHQAKLGCNVNGDCRVGGAGSVTYCEGSSCFDHQPISGTGAYLTINRSSRVGSYNDGLNKSCTYKTLAARCDTGWNWGGDYAERDVWIQTPVARARNRVDSDLSGPAELQTPESQQEEPSTHTIEVELLNGKTPDLVNETPQEDSAPDKVPVNTKTLPFRVVSIPPGIDCPSNCTSEFAAKEDVKLVWVSQDKKSRIRFWDGDACIRGNKRINNPQRLEAMGLEPTAGFLEASECNFTVNEDKKILLRFNER